MRFFTRAVFLCLVLGAALAHAATPPPEALLVVIGDSHSAYDRVAQFVAQIDRLKEQYPHVPLGVLIDGDAFEEGNAIAKRSHAEIDLAFLAALAKRAPTILNLGNHEMDFFGPAEAVEKIRATGVVVISGNARDRATGQPLAPASTTLQLGALEATVVGLVTEHLTTFRKAIQPELDLADPVVWAKQSLSALLQDKPLPIVLSHAGLAADREILKNYRNAWDAGGLFAGAHDHLRFVYKNYYFHSGSWLEYFTLARLERRGGAGQLSWRLEQIPVDPAGPADPDLAALVKRVRAHYLTAEDSVVVGHLDRPMSTAEAAQFAAEALARAAQVDTGFIGNTTFGAGLPAGPVTQLDFDACVRFDGPVFTAVVDGARLSRLLETANGRGFDFDRSSGEFNFAGGRMEGIDADKRYKIATSDWGAKNSARYFGEPALQWTEVPAVKLKAAVRAALAKIQSKP
jgi:2',3'-cyclic-nucleotide 2'-phosphodiesterase (5'-nucleotidase family)